MHIRAEGCIGNYCLHDKQYNIIPIYTSSFINMECLYSFMNPIALFNLYSPFLHKEKMYLIYYQRKNNFLV